MRSDLTQDILTRLKIVEQQVKNVKLEKPTIYSVHLKFGRNGSNVRTSSSRSGCGNGRGGRWWSSSSNVSNSVCINGAVAQSRGGLKPSIKIYNNKNASKLTFCEKPAEHVTANLVLAFSYFICTVPVFIEQSAAPQIALWRGPAPGRYSNLRWADLVAGTLTTRPSHLTKNQV